MEEFNQNVIREFRADQGKVAKMEGMPVFAPNDDRRQDWPIADAATGVNARWRPNRRARFLRRQ